MSGKQLPWPKQVAVDCETNGLAIYCPTKHVTHVSTWYTNGTGCVRKLPLKPQDRVNLSVILQDYARLKLFFNCSFDIPFLRKAGFKVLGPVIDVKLMSQLVFPDEHSHDLKSLSKLRRVG